MAGTVWWHGRRLHIRLDTDSDLERVEVVCQALYGHFYYYYYYYYYYYCCYYCYFINIMIIITNIFVIIIIIIIIIIIALNNNNNNTNNSNIIIIIIIKINSLLDRQAMHVGPSEIDDMIESRAAAHYRRSLADKGL